ncbi:hypothetical protein [Moritella viscosa]|uniref:hypothetical protein n=1 Tax=Moritella viscosa TaxID=80854 RepID=UPI0009163233|nr:hypothetical protein [Moritella viscosa]SGZ09509.1 Tripartite ATP-independent periplasmic transporters, DctQ component [Moritella viscosa]
MIEDLKDLKALLAQPYNMFYTLMMWLSLSLGIYFKGHEESTLNWQIEYPLISAVLFGLLVTLLITLSNAIPSARGTEYDRIISYILFMLTAFIFYKAAHEINIQLTLGAASACWMGLEQGKNRINNNISSTKGNNQ